VQAGAGVEIHVRQGERATEGQPLLTLHTDDPGRVERAKASLEGGIDIATERGHEPRPLVLDRIG
jgi:thymidine phosphorylase